MKILHHLIIVALAIAFTNCDEQPKKITNTNDYNAYLEPAENEMLRLTIQDVKFWEEKLEKEPYQFPYLVKAATSHSQLFKETGNIEELIAAEQQLLMANKQTNYKTPSYLRALAHNYISQHKFREALELLKKAESIGDGLNGTQKMLFDVYLELGNIKEAKNYLGIIENYKDFDFLIRLSKWSDHEGDLDKAILYLEKATEMAEATKDQRLMEWAYSNLADFYGHNGEISKSYDYYLSALKSNPNSTYAKKGIAWIVYSYEDNSQEALRILDAIMMQHKSPDYYLLKAEIAEYMNDWTAKKTYLNEYLSEVKKEQYGNMYNKYNVILYTEDLKQTNEAAKIALSEIHNRPTAQSYDLLAWAYYNYGDIKEAMKIMETYVVDKTHEPEALYHLASVYKANGKLKEAKNLKDELMDSTFELGPLMAQKIRNL